MFIFLHTHAASRAAMEMEGIERSVLAYVSAFGAEYKKV